MQEYWDLLFKNDHSQFICRHTGETVVWLQEVKSEAFNPKNRTNRQCSRRVIELGGVAFQAILSDMMNKNKATYRYLSWSWSKLSWKGCPGSAKKATLGLEAMNDYTESALGGTTHELTKFGRINQDNAATISDNHHNKYYDRSGWTKKKGKCIITLCVTFYLILKCTTLLYVLV